mgnify:CR=1 FL=1|tara:strand:- start:4274 stop:4471 length:198 start_codon:yes stop_codon:yes gene_type:complete
MNTQTKTFYKVESTENIFSPPSFKTLEEAKKYILETPNKGDKDYYSWYATTLYINKVTQIIEKVG